VPGKPPIPGPQRPAHVVLVIRPLGRDVRRAPADHPAHRGRQRSVERAGDVEPTSPRRQAGDRRASHQPGVDQRGVAGHGETAEAKQHRVQSWSPRDTRYVVGDPTFSGGRFSGLPPTGTTDQYSTIIRPHKAQTVGGISLWGKNDRDKKGQRLQFNTLVAAEGQSCRAPTTAAPPAGREPMCSGVRGRQGVIRKP
jgi:hypothetical protein